MRRVDVVISSEVGLTERQESAIKAIAFQSFAVKLVTDFFVQRGRKYNIYRDARLSTVIKDAGIDFINDYLIYFKSKGWIAAHPIQYLYAIRNGSTQEQWSKVLRYREYDEMRIVRVHKVAKRPDLILVTDDEPRVGYIFDTKYTDENERKIYLGDVLRLFVYREVLRRARFSARMPVLVVNTDSVKFSHRLGASSRVVDINNGYSSAVTVDYPFAFEWGILSAPALAETLNVLPRVFVRVEGNTFVVYPYGDESPNSVLHVGRITRRGVVL